MYLKQAEELSVLLSSKGHQSSSFIKVQDAGNVLLEAPEKLSEAILLFCQGVGLIPAVLGSRRRAPTRGMSMSEADKPNVSRLSLSE